MARIAEEQAVGVVAGDGASGEDDQRPAFRPRLPQRAHKPQRFAFRPPRDGATVQHADVGLCRIGGRLEAGGQEVGREARLLGLVQAAAEGMEKDAH